VISAIPIPRCRAIRRISGVKCRPTVGAATDPRSRRKRSDSVRVGRSVVTRNVVGKGTWRASQSRRKDRARDRREGWLAELAAGDDLSRQPMVSFPFRAAEEDPLPDRYFASGRTKASQIWKSSSDCLVSRISTLPLRNSRAAGLFALTGCAWLPLLRPIIGRERRGYCSSQASRWPAIAGKFAKSPVSELGEVRSRCKHARRGAVSERLLCDQLRWKVESNSDTSTLRV